MPVLPPPGTEERRRYDFERIQQHNQIRDALNARGENEIRDPWQRYNLDQQRKGLNIAGREFEQGTAGYYQDTFGTALAGMQEGQSINQIMQNILQRYGGKPEHLKDWIEHLSPFLQQYQTERQIEALRGSEGFQHIQDSRNWDLGAMTGYGVGAGAIQRGAAQATRVGQQRLAASGLGRSAALASMQQMNQNQANSSQAGLWANMYGQAQRNRMASAGNALDAHRLLAQMALGQTPNPRMFGGGATPDGGGGPNPTTSTLTGAAQGASAGSSAGPWGALIGGLVGAGAGYYSSQ